MSDRILREHLIRLAHARPEFRGALLPLLASEDEGEEAPTKGKFEKGKPTDPTENMTEEQKKEWWAEHGKNKDKFTKDAARASRLKTDIRLRSGDTIPAGSMATVAFNRDRPSNAIVTVEGRRNPVKVSVINLHHYFSGFAKPPTQATLMKWSMDGVSRTPTGKVVKLTDGDQTVLLRGF